MADTVVGWRLVEGVRPNIQEFTAPIEFAGDFANMSGPVTLELDDLIVNFVYVLAVGPGENPNLVKVRVADRRVWWPYRHVRRFFNIRRNIGVKRFTDPTVDPANQTVLPSVWYQPWSLRDSTAGADPRNAKWNARQCIVDVLAEAQYAEVEGFRVEPFRVLFPEVGFSLDQIEIEDLRINDGGDQATARTLAYMPEVGVYVTPSGDVRVYSKVSGSERDLVFSPKMVGEGDVRLVDNSLIRPKKIRLLYEYMVEVRFDFTEDTRKSSTSTLGADQRYCQNVVSIPDFQLVVNGRTFTQGTWLELTTALNSWWTAANGGALVGFSSGLDYPYIRAAVVPFVDLWARIGITGAFNPDADQAARVAAIQHHYRRTFRLNRRWVDRCRAIKASRVSTIDPTTGTRAPAPVYSHYCLFPSQREMFNSTVSSSDSSYAVNVKGYPTDGNINADTKSAPAHVSVVDADQGIVHIDWMIDPQRYWEAILPGVLTLKDQEDNVDADGIPLVAGPSADMKNKGRPISFDAVSSDRPEKTPLLRGSYKLSIILTLLPAGTNDKRQFYEVTVKPGDVALFLSAGARVGLDNARGPIMDVYIGPEIEVARVAWKDDRATDIEKLFGVGDDPKPPNIAGLVLNDGPAGGGGGASLQIISKAAAARVYASLADRYEGEMATDMDPTFEPTGWVSEIAHELHPNGVLMTRIGFPTRIPMLDLFSFLDSSTRALILKLATPEKTE